MAEEARSGAATALNAYRRPIAPVSSFKYIGRVLLESDDDCSLVVCNLRRGAEEVGAADMGVGEVGVGCPEIGDILRCSDAGGSSI